MSNENGDLNNLDDKSMCLAIVSIVMSNFSISLSTLALRYFLNYYIIITYTVNSMQLEVRSCTSCTLIAIYECTGYQYSVTKYNGI